MNTRLTKFLAVAALLTGSQYALAAGDDFEGTARDAWITGKVETAYTLNRHLNPFTIDTDVTDGVVVLNGKVDTEIERDLAVEIARGIDGVVNVTDNLEIEPGSKAASSAAINDGKRDFGTWFDDATTTASVKSRLVANENVKGLEIDVDTNNDKVTLSGRVGTEEERQLAEQLAQNVTDVHEVVNHLVVDPE
jgi:osmotically-inducible protein OsmY